MTLKRRIQQLEQQHEAEHGGIRWIIISYAGEEGPTPEELHRAEAAYIERFGESEGAWPIPCLVCGEGVIATEPQSHIGEKVVVGTYVVVPRPAPGYRQRLLDQAETRLPGEDDVPQTTPPRPSLGQAPGPAPEPKIIDPWIPEGTPRQTITYGM